MYPDTEEQLELERAVAESRSALSAILRVSWLRAAMFYTLVIAAGGAVLVYASGTEYASGGPLVRVALAGAMGFLVLAVAIEQLSKLVCNVSERWECSECSRWRGGEQ